MLIGFVIWGVAIALQVQANLSLSPWDVFHQGLGNHLGIGIVLMAVGSALYLPARLGTGPRDGVMVGLNRKFGYSIRLARTIVEVMALVIGFLLGGTVGLGTLVVALGLGPTVQAMLQARRWLVERITGVPQSVL